MIKEVLHNQTLLDITVEHTGSLEALFSIAEKNWKSITEELEVGEVIKIETIEDAKVLKFYDRKKVNVATGLTEMSGIGYDPIPLIIY